MGVCIEGSDKFWPMENSKAQLPVFDSYNNQTFYIEVFNAGKTSFSYEILFNQINGLKFPILKGELNNKPE